MEFSWEIKIKGFGPFATQAGGLMSLNNSRVAIYSGNGQGKTCISRLFRTADADAQPLADSVINRTGNNGTFDFRVADGSSQSKELHVTMARGGSAAVANSTGYIFHVFNSDYIRDNLSTRHFSPSGDGFTGYIIGKENIDVSDKKDQLAELNRRGQEKFDAIEKAVQTARRTLSDLGLSRLRGYTDLTTQNILAMAQCESDYESKLREFEALRGLPEPIPTLAGLRFDAGQVDLESIRALLPNRYTRDSFADEFLAEVQPKRDFISRGLQLTKDGKCPYCGRPYDNDSDVKALIHNYEEYIRGAEAKTIAEIEGHIRALSSLYTSFEQFILTYQAKKTQYDALKPAFASISQTELLDIVGSTDMKEAIDDVVESLTSKMEDISIAYDADPATKLLGLLNDIGTAITTADNYLAQFDRLAADASKTLTNVKRDLCAEMARKVRAECDAVIAESEAIAQDYKQLDAEIKADEVKGRRPKRAAIAQMLANMIHAVFGDRYVFDPEQFTISLGDSLLGDDAENVMSDGEKSALAFCHYVASTWNLLGSDDDADNLFFIIDDPISSLDYHYVYSVLQIIRDLNVAFDLNRVRFLLMTHNSAFFNMLARNGVAKECFVFHDGTFEVCKSHYITPYNEHLKDLYKVALGESTPMHTTGNSIRQVIESLWRFDNPASKDLLEYLNTPECSVLKDCEYIYSVCQDQSHGASLFDRDQAPDDEAIRRACWSVLTHVHERYPGQLIASSIDFALLSQGEDSYKG